MTVERFQHFNEFGNTYKDPRENPSLLVYITLYRVNYTCVDRQMRLHRGSQLYSSRRVSKEVYHVVRHREPGYHNYQIWAWENSNRKIERKRSEFHYENFYKFKSEPINIWWLKQYSTTVYDLPRYLHSMCLYKRIYINYASRDRMKWSVMWYSMCKSKVQKTISNPVLQWLRLINLFCVWFCPFFRQGERRKLTHCTFPASIHF